jgi:hypothetical protein
VGEGWDGGNLIIKKSDLTYFLFIPPFLFPPEGKTDKLLPPWGKAGMGVNLLLKSQILLIFCFYPVSHKGEKLPLFWG